MPRHSVEKPKSFRSVGVPEEFYDWLTELSKLFKKARGDVMVMLVQQSNPEKFLVQSYMRLVRGEYYKDQEPDVDGLAKDTYANLRFMPDGNGSLTLSQYHEWAKEVFAP